MNKTIVSLAALVQDIGVFFQLSDIDSFEQSSILTSEVKTLLTGKNIPPHRYYTAQFIQKNKNVFEAVLNKQFSDFFDLCVGLNSTEESKIIDSAMSLACGAGAEIHVENKEVLLTSIFGDLLNKNQVNNYTIKPKPAMLSVHIPPILNQKKANDFQSLWNNFNTAFSQLPTQSEEGLFDSTLQLLQKYGVLYQSISKGLNQSL